MGEEKARLLTNKMYKFSHIGIYGGDDDEKVSGRQDKRRGITVHGVAARASALDAAISKHP